MLNSSQPATHGLPMPRATTAACEVMPPCAVRIPCAAIMPWMSSGEVSQPTRIRASVSPRCAAESASSTILPDAAPGDAFSPLAARSEEHTSELQSHVNLVCRLLLEKKKNTIITGEHSTKKITLPKK